MFLIVREKSFPDPLPLNFSGTPCSKMNAKWINILGAFPGFCWTQSKYFLISLLALQLMKSWTPSDPERNDGDLGHLDVTWYTWEHKNIRNSYTVVYRKNIQNPATLTMAIEINSQCSPPLLVIQSTSSPNSWAGILITMICPDCNYIDY